MKRLIDIIVAALALLLLWPLIAVLALLIRLETAGNPLYCQIRLGRDQRPFTMWKLRSMQQGTPLLGTHEIPADQFTRIGTLIRKTKLDELPQAFNVLRGDMSLVGPRPCLPGQHQVIEERRKHDVFRIRPGITGLAQIRGIDMSRPAELALCDHDYMNKQSLLFDLRICIATIMNVVSKSF